MQGTKTLNKQYDLNNKFNLEYLFYFLVVIISFFVGVRSYMFFHTFIELFCVIIAFMITAIAINTYDTNVDKRIIFFGIAYGFVGLFDVLHMLTYKGIELFGNDSANLTAQLWIVARYIESISYLLLGSTFSKEFNIRRNFLLYTIITTLLFISIFHFRNFPVCFEYGQGQTTFKIYSEYIISIILTVAALLFIKNKNNKRRNTSKLILSGIVSTILSESIFAFFYDRGDIYLAIGHILKAISFYFIYLASVKTSIREPYLHLVKINSLFTDRNRDLEEAFQRLKREYDMLKTLKQNEYRKSEILNAILETSINGILVIGHDERIIHYNKTFVEIMNLSMPIEKNASRSSLVKLVREQLLNKEAYIQNVDRIRNDLKEPFTQILYLKDGRIVEATSVPFDEGGYETGVLTIYSDITKRLRIQELEKDLQIKQATIEKAKEYDELKDIFLSTVAHEFRTPLTILLGTIQLIEGLHETIEYSNPPVFYNYIRLMKKNCYRLTKLTNNLVDIKKIDTGFFDIDLKNQNIIEIIEDITLSVAKYTESKELTLIFDTDVEEKILACDSYLLERVMLNLLSNSVKFTEKGGIIEVSVYDNDNVITISVKDNGIGIPKEKADIIFDRFRQVDASLNRRSEGSGIGLALVKLIVERHNGRIYLNTDLEEGTEFIIELPVQLLDDKCICELYIPKKTNVERIEIEFSDIYDI